MTRRFGQVIGIKPEFIDEYERIHAEVWPGVLAMIETCNVRNYSIYRYNDMLFAYLEYIGEDFEADMAKMAADEVTQKWRTVCQPMHRPVEDRAEGEWWHTMVEIFHTD
jgi:L-rhamnose mutarotase